MTAYEFGAEMARLGEPFAPELVFVSESHMGEYAAGFLSIQPDNPAALSFTGQFDSRLAEMRAADLAVDEAQYTPRPGYDF